MSNPLHELFIQAEQPDNHNSLMKVLADLSSRYEFISQIHLEETRSVSKYKDLASGRDVILLHLISEKEKDIQKFKEEMKISSNLEHPGIVPLYDAGRDDEGLFFARKWINDKSLKQRFQDNVKIWNKEQALRIFVQLCEALNYAHSKGISHGNLKAEKVFISESGIPIVTDWSKAASQNAKGIAQDIRALGGMLLPIMKLCLDFDSIPGGLKAIARKSCLPKGSYVSVKQMIADLHAYRQGYVPRATRAFFIKSAFQFFKRNPFFCIVLSLSAAFIVCLSIWFFENLNQKQKVIDTNLQKGQVKKTAANKALKEFLIENELRKEIAMEAAEAYAAVARNALRIGDIDKAREMESIAWQLSEKEKFTKEMHAHLAFIDQRYEEAIKYYNSENIRYFDVILKLCEKYKKNPPGITELLQDYEYNDRKELTLFSIHKLLFKKSGEELNNKFIEVIKYFNPEAEVKLQLNLSEGKLKVNLSGSRNIKTLEFLQGMPINTLDIRNTGISNVDLNIIPQLKKILFNKGQVFKASKSVERISK